MSDFAFMREDASRIVIGYGLTQVEKTEVYEWWEIYFYKQQTPLISLQIVKDAIIKDINDRVDANILCGYPWTVLHGADEGKAVKVWLSKENQGNFEAKYNLHFTNPNALTFPTEYKIAEDDNKEGIFEEFQTFEELEVFYLGGLNYIEQCYKAGWAEKKAFDWAPYEALFPQTEQANAGE